MCGFPTNGEDMATLTTVTEKGPLGQAVAWGGVLNSVAHSVVFGLHGRVHLCREQVGTRISFADGTTARVYRETVVEAGPTREPCVLLVAYRLRFVRGWGHALFRWESLLNTPLFVGFPGLRTKLWLAHDPGGVYRGFYEWDSPYLAEQYARSLWRVLALVCVPRSIHYVVLPGLRRSDILDDPGRWGPTDPIDADVWWRPVRIS